MASVWKQKAQKVLLSHPPPPKKKEKKETERCPAWSPFKMARDDKMTENVLMKKKMNDFMSVKKTPEIFCCV